MTFADALNKHACSCGLEEGVTWFSDSNGNTPETVEGFRLAKNNHGVRVEHEDGGFAVEAFDENGEAHWALFDSDYTWSDLD